MPNNEWGDFQTPAELAQQVIDSLSQRIWTRVLEPTCGEGSFLDATRRLGEVERIGIEIQERYAKKAEATGARVLKSSIFDLDLSRDLRWNDSGPLLVVGNPPWVTNADLGTYGSINLPPKRNLKNLRGIDALTGASNFDIAEYIWLKLIIELMPSSPTIALLCKTQVARNVLSFCFQNGLPISDASICRIDARRWFGASVDACLFRITVGGDATWRCPVFASFDAEEPESVIGFSNGRLVADIDSLETARLIDGTCPLEWRQGVKHDAAAVMELQEEPSGQLINKLGEVVDVEAEFVFPLLKATDVHRNRLNGMRRVLVTQTKLSEDTASLAERAPKLWRYLVEHGAAFDARKSSIYRARPRFAMFGIGNYTFARWKVAVSGLHKEATFRVLAPAQGKPILLDDTCYFVAFDHPEPASLVAAALQTPLCLQLLASLTFTDSKRPITKKLLQRIDLVAVIKAADQAQLLSDAQAAMERPHCPTSSDIDLLLADLSGGRLELALS